MLDDDRHVGLEQAGITGGVRDRLRIGEIIETKVPRAPWSDV